jgi:hypothetical protein
MNRHFVSDAHEHIDFIYFGYSETDTVVPENEDDTWLWLTETELQNNTEIEPTIKHYALSALRFYQT